MISIVYIALLWWSQSQEATGNPIMIATEAISIATSIYKGAQEFRKLIGSGEGIDDKLIKGDVAVLTKLERLDDHISKLHEQINFLKTNAELDKISTRMYDIFKVVHYVNDTYTKFLDLIEARNCIERDQLMKLFNHSVYDYRLDGLNTAIHEMYRNFIDPDGAGRDSLLARLSSAKDELMCNRKQSNQQTLSHVYNSIVNTDLKTLALRLVADEMFAEDKKAEDSELKVFKRRMNELSDAAREFIVSAPRHVWRCDPNSPIEGLTYLKLQEVFQALITNERDTEEDTCSWSYCYQLHDWENIKIGKAKRQLYRANTVYAKDWQPPKRQCYGHITECKEMTERIDYCIAPEPDYRRYTGLRNDDGTIYGEDFEMIGCSNPDKAIAVKSGMYDCKFCLCTCASKNRLLDRYFSLEDVVSNYADRWIVTGVRIKKKNHVFYIDIQEGRLGENGTIERDSEHWRNYTNVGKYRFEEIARINAHRSNETGDFPVNDLVYSVNWEQKTVYLDDAVLNKVVVGVRFRQQGDALKLQVRFANFQFATGNMPIIDNEWFPKDDEIKFRQRIVLANADDPIKLMTGKNPSKHKLDSSGKFLKFAVTNLRKDIGSSTIPYIDTQEVVSNPPVPLCGIGLYHKGMESGKSGGFLGLKLIQCNFAARNY